jgi:hypothetical protein
LGSHCCGDDGVITAVRGNLLRGTGVAGAGGRRRSAGVGAAAASGQAGSQEGDEQGGGELGGRREIAIQDLSFEKLKT